MSNGYNVSATSGLDYSSLMNNPYLYMAMMSPNVNFKGQAQQAQVSGTTEAAAVSSGAIPVTTQTAAQSSGMSVGGGILTAGILAIGAYGIIRGRKSGFFKNAFKKLTGKSSDSTTEAITKLTAIKTEDGIRLLQPGKTEVIKELELKTFMKKNGIIFTNAQKEFQGGVSNITHFEYGKYKVTVKDGEITEIFDETNTKNILANLKNAPETNQKNKDYKSIIEILSELGKTKDADKDILGKAINIRFTNTYGDDVLALSLPKIGDKAELKELTTLKRFKFTDPEIQALKLSDAEKAFTQKAFIEKCEIGQNISIGKYFDDIAGEKCVFAGNKLVSVIKDGVEYKQGSYHYEEFYDKHKKAIDSIINNVFAKHDKKKISVGTIFNV